MTSHTGYEKHAFGQNIAFTHLSCLYVMSCESYQRDTFQRVWETRVIAQSLVYGCGVVLQTTVILLLVANGSSMSLVGNTLSCPQK